MRASIETKKYTHFFKVHLVLLRCIGAEVQQVRCIVHAQNVVDDGTGLLSHRQLLLHL